MRPRAAPNWPKTVSKTPNPNSPTTATTTRAETLSLTVQGQFSAKMSNTSVTAQIREQAQTHLVKILIRSTRAKLSERASWDKPQEAWKKRTARESLGVADKSGAEGISRMFRVAKTLRNLARKWSFWKSLLVKKRG